VSPAAVERLTLGELETNCWLVSAGPSEPLIVIDPAAEPDVLLAAIRGRAVAVVVLTHGHFDHLGAVSAVCAATGAPLLVHADDASVITSAEANGGAAFGFDAVAPRADRVLRDGDIVEAGALRLEVIHTPGHTPGSICLFTEGPAGALLFSGDTLFAGSIGRADFAGGDPRAMRASIARLAALPSNTAVFPGHGPGTTIERESRVNFFWPRA
jgi:hydroxyacylglutathione hydrolase